MEGASSGVSHPKPLRVLILAGRLDVSASSIYTVKLAVELSRRVSHVTVMGPGGPLGRDLIRQGVEFLEEDLSTTFILDVFRVGSLVKRIRRLKPDVLHVTDINLARHGAFAAHLCRVPYLLTVHSTPPVGRLPLALDQLYRVIAVTEQIRQSLVNSAQVPRDRVQLIENGVEAHTDTPAYWAPGEIPLVGVFGPLERGSGLKYFLRVARSVLDAGGEAHFAIIGDGPLDRRLRQVTREMGLAGSVVIALPGAEYQRILGSLDLFVLPFIDEGFGFAVLEAMARAKPVIMSGIGGAYSLVEDGETGYLVGKKDVSAFARRILDLLADSKKAISMGTRGRELALSRFPLEKLVTETLGLYREAVATNSATTA